MNRCECYIYKKKRWQITLKMLIELQSLIGEEKISVWFYCSSVQAQDAASRWGRVCGDEKWSLVE